MVKHETSSPWVTGEMSFTENSLETVYRKNTWGLRNNFLLICAQSYETKFKYHWRLIKMDPMHGMRKYQNA